MDERKPAGGGKGLFGFPLAGGLRNSIDRTLDGLGKTARQSDAHAPAHAAPPGIPDKSPDPAPAANPCAALVVPGRLLYFCFGLIAVSGNPWPEGKTMAVTQ